MKEIWIRIKSETPKFWKRLRKVALSVGGCALALVVANKTMELNVDVHIITVAQYLIAVCVTISGSATLTKTDNENKSN